jgi:branched-chain amino acid aminotransferase
MMVFLNGQFVPEAQAVVPVSDRGFLYGDGLFETMRICNGKPFRIAEHLERMARGADFLKIKLPFTPKQLQQFATHLIEQNKLPESVLRITLTRGSGERGYSPKTSGTPTLVMTLHPAPAMNAGQQHECTMVTSSFHIPANDALAAFKTGNKLLNVAARIEAEAKGMDEALLLNTNGEAVETAGGNLFWIYGDMVCTTPADHGILPGITRAIVLEICQALGLETNEQAIKPDALRNADALFLTQSVLGIVSVTSWDGKPAGSSKWVKKIHDVYCELLTKESL